MDVYLSIPIDMSADFYVRYLEGYTLEKENSLTIYGSNLKRIILFHTKTGGYFEIEKMLLM
jgi:esterase/lipase superfamily enzyme